MAYRLSFRRGRPSADSGFAKHFRAVSHVIEELENVLEASHDDVILFDLTNRWAAAFQQCSALQEAALSVPKLGNTKPVSKA